MKKIFTVALLFIAVIMSAQEVPTSFPRKYLIEHFTGEDCGYCPLGMYNIVDYCTNRTNTPCIWVSHHYGYGDDEYSIPESTMIGAACGVNGAPNMAINRTKITGLSIAFSPADILPAEGMEELIADKCDTMAEASVVIEHTYKAEMRELNVTVSGQVADASVTKYLLTVLIKENGLIGKQADYAGYSWKSAGFKEFLHPCVIRDVLCSDAMGDEVAVENQAYSKSYTFTMPENWVAENCCVVAYITPTTKKPIINAEEAPLVAGTTGGREYLPFGITEQQAPNAATNLKFDTLELSKPTEDKMEIKLVASQATRDERYGPVKMVVTLEFNTLDTILPTQTLEFVDGDVLNTFSTGTVDLGAQTFGGSRMQYYLSADMETFYHTWRIKSGTMTVASNGGFLVEGKLDNGKSFKITCNMLTALENVVFDKTHVEKLMRDGQIVIRMDDVEYDMQGRVITQ